jgi:hypothetical protein
MLTNISFLLTAYSPTFGTLCWQHGWPSRSLVPICSCHVPWQQHTTHYNGIKRQRLSTLPSLAYPQNCNHYGNCLLEAPVTFTVTMQTVAKRKPVHCTSFLPSLPLRQRGYRLLTTPINIVLVKHIVLCFMNIGIHSGATFFFVWRLNGPHTYLALS